jgi:hypothetical protein
MPKGTVGATGLDFRANGRMKVTVVAAQVRDGNGISTNLVYRFSTANGRIRLQKIYEVGDGDLVTGSDISSSAPRFDFASITLLPDGRIAVSFIDKQYPTPALAIQQ